MDKKQLIILILECVMLIVAVILLVFGIILGETTRIITCLAIISILAFNIMKTLKKK